MLRFSSYDIVMQEIPNEVSLVFSITGCTLACEGCHSRYLWNSNKGENLTNGVLINLLDKYENNISCVLFMGGEWEITLLSSLQIIKDRGIKTALYTGLTENQMSKKYVELINNLDYIKYGRWVTKLGGLDSKKTNQKLINLNTGENLNYYFIKN